jgi:hypothetical protein
VTPFSGDGVGARQDAAIDDDAATDPRAAVQGQVY